MPSTIVTERGENDRKKADPNNDRAESYGEEAPVPSRVTAILNDEPGRML